MILVDNNLSYRVASVLKATYKGIVHVSNVGLEAEADLVLWAYATNHQLSILTKDADFNHIQQMKGFPPKIIWIKSGNVPTKQIIALLKNKESAIKQFMDNPELGLLEIW
ncbi:MAG: DUF5615 family PIN-like protein [Bacteroidota bacterium]